MDKNNNKDMLKIMLSTVQSNKEQAEIAEATILELLNTKDEVSRLSKVTEEFAARSKRSELVSIKVAELVMDKYTDIVMREKLEDWESDEISEMIAEKTTEITRKLFPTLKAVRKRGEEYLKEWILVNRGLYSIYKKNVNGHKGKYTHTKRTKFSAAKEYVTNLSVNDYLSYRDGEFKSIQKFYFEEPLILERVDIEKMINDQIDPQDNVAI